jgi:hypothetical protein
MMKKVWITSVESDQKTVQDLMVQLKPYGLEANGHFWEDNLEKMSWAAAREELIDPNVSLWGILLSAENLKNPALRFGLSLLAIAVQAQKGYTFPIVLLVTQGEVSSQDLPTPLRGADIASYKDPGLGAKIVAKTHSPKSDVASDYRLDIYGNPQIGQWFEVGPQNNAWQGVLFGVSGGKITFHAVGPKGSLPSKSTLNYPMQGLELNQGEQEYTAWAVQNQIDPDSSYFIKVEEFPERIVFGPATQDNQAEVFIVDLK